MRYFSPSQIDKVKWDELVAVSPSPIVYTASWFLDSVYPQWGALIWEDKHTTCYKAAIPLPARHFWFVKWVQIPYYVQQTGLICRTEYDPQLFLKEFFESRIHTGYVSFNIAFQSDLSQLVALLSPSVWEKRIKKNFLLSLHLPYSSLLGNYNENRRRNLKKAYKNGWTCDISEDIDAALLMYRAFQMTKQKEVDSKALETVRHLYASAQQLGLAELYVVRNQNGEPLAYAFFIRYQTRLYFFFSAMNEEGKMYSASSLPFDHVIKKYAGQAFTLDFEGGNIDSIGHYFASFGASPEEYVSLSYNVFDFLIGNRK